MDTLSLTKAAKIYSEEKKISLTSDVGKGSGLLGEVPVRGISRTEYPVFGFIGMSWISYNELYTGQGTSE